MGWTRGILAHWAQLGTFSSGNSRGRLKELRLRLSMGAAGARHAAARFTGITSLPRWKICTTASRECRGCCHPHSLCSGFTLPLYVIHEEAGGIPVSDNYYPTLQPVA